MKKIIFSLLVLTLLFSIKVYSNNNPNMVMSDDLNKYLNIKIEPIKDLSNDFIMGMDVSMLKQIEENGGKYYDDNGVEKDVLEILKEHGINYIRLRLWNNPESLGGGNCNFQTVKDLASRAKKIGMNVCLDFHYSDFWADPGKQNKPAVWKDLSFEELKNAVYDFTYNSLKKLAQVDALPAMVQVGNELNGGMLWPEGKTWGDNAGGFTQFAILLQAGLNAVDTVSKEEATEIKTVVHLADGGDNELYTWFFDELIKRQVTNFDVIGLSYYPYWHGTFEEFKFNINGISQRYDKEVAVMETGYAYTLKNGDSLENMVTQKEIDRVNKYAETNYSASIKSQAQILRKIIKIVNEVPDEKGIGVFYWEGEWIPVDGAGWKSGEGNAWENQAMFDFNGKVLPSLDVFYKVYNN
ncbi:glycosyl hydrolase 53 family protein [Halocella sp. SP3-1]|uniref:glycoside hydrolase family 53 protein n=1 Tax=Halocella sp. SP3-1 TaxID=2382161 RepID=UPI000F75DF3A|nr:glycosyl hydrolase 53 family protein [Halocella sp. SP3-1]AZO96369.1 hypothetical protein D7D81_18210 [Halocella sp. SP3-1]